MKRLNDAYLKEILSIVPLHNKNLLEIGCGNGTRTLQIAKHCGHISGIDSDAEAIRQAQQSGIANVEFFSCPAERLIFRKSCFDATIFTLSFHHVAANMMGKVINEAIRVTRPEGHIIFLEPTMEGSFFDAEILYGACDGDEREQKRNAYTAMTNHANIRQISEQFDTTQFAFESLDDFIESLHTTSDDRDGMIAFLNSHQWKLTAQRRINIFTLIP